MTYITNEWFSWYTYYTINNNTQAVVDISQILTHRSICKVSVQVPRTYGNFKQLIKRVSIEFTDLLNDNAGANVLVKDNNLFSLCWFIY